MILSTGTRKLAPFFVIATLFGDQKRNQVNQEEEECIKKEKAECVREHMTELSNKRVTNLKEYSQIP